MREPAFGTPETSRKRPLASDNAVTWRKYAEQLEVKNEALDSALDRMIEICIVVVHWAAQRPAPGGAGTNSGRGGGEST